jgi:plastocyanin
MPFRVLTLPVFTVPVLAAAFALANPATQRAAVAPAPRPSQATAAPAVHISNFTFGPALLKVKVGQTVTWTNDDDIPHTVVAVDHSFKSKVLDTGEHFTFTFTKAGLFPYFCSLHPHMTGKIMVTAK